MDHAAELFDFLMSELGRVPQRNPKAHETCQVILRECERTTSIDPLLVLGLIYTESGYRTQAVSPAGARGLMQLMPATAEELARGEQIPWGGPDALFDPVTNVTLGIRYLVQLYDHYNKAWPKALTAYNRGMGNVHKILTAHDGVIPQNILAAYSDLVLQTYYAFARSFAQIPTV